MYKSKLCKVLFFVCGILIFLAAGVLNMKNTAASESCIIYSEGGDFREYITGSGTYFDWIRAFYVDGNGQVAYCTQSDQTPAVGVDNVYTPNSGAICNSSYLHKAVTAIASNGYPLKYGSYIVGGDMKNPEYKTGLIIGKTIYECTSEEARAATAFAIHRRVIAYSGIDDAASGNDVTITNIANGRNAVHDVVAIQNVLYSNTDNEYALTLEWAAQNENGTFGVVGKPEPVQSDGYFNYYVKASSKNCYINSIAPAEGEEYIAGCVIENIWYVSAFERYIHLKVPKQNVNNKKVGIICTSTVPETEEALVLGHSSYQDFMIVPYGKEISANISVDYPGGDLELIKKDDETNVVLPNAVYGIYADEGCTNKLYEVTTDNEGRAYLKDIPSGKYYIKEINAPYGYVTDESVCMANVSNGEKTSLLLKDKRVRAEIELEKQDADTQGNVPQGDASLSGAVYGIYAREDIVYPDKNAEVKYRAGDLIGQITIGDDCKGGLDNLYLGKYYAKELSAPEGYVLDEAEYDIDCSVSDGTSEVIKAKRIVSDRVKSQAFQLVKVGGDRGDEQLLIEHAGFTVWLLSDLEIKENGEYDFNSAEPYPASADGGCEIFTDERGYACSTRLPYGTYIVKETTIPSGYKPIQDFIVTIDEESAEPKVWRIFNDDEFMARLIIEKVDGSTGKTILRPGYEFKVYDVKNGCYVEQEISYPKKERISVFATNDEGYLMLPKPLKAGEYRIEETGCPKEGYALSKETVTIKIDSDLPYELQEGEPVIHVEFPNYPVYGSITIRKAYELKDDFMGVILSAENRIGENQSAENTVFSLYAAEDIYTYDYHVDENGNRVKLYSKDEKVEEMTVNMETPYCTVDHLPIGNYYIVEDKTLSGYVCLDKPIETEIAYADEKTEYVEVSVEVENDLTTTKIFKKDKETEDNVKYATLCIYDEDGRLVDKWISDDEAHITKGLTLGNKYILTEEEAPEGYEKAEEIEFTFEENNQEITIYNERTKLVLGETGTFEKTTPQTGDSFHPFICVVLLSVVGLIIIILRSLLKAR
ncbi:MAG: SpaA isopeptide-forming pilin-related protein [Clostridium sp.]|nr:SpaA isopeptide-forming pilin-related protein [Clostridium sp.]MCM1207560.1 SpaA isopeptide-forming pilin-related protein [Ruminococcus sp.]